MLKVVPTEFNSDVMIDASSSTAVGESTTIMEDKESNRSKTQQRLRSILTFILVAMMIMAIPLFLVSTVWFIVYVIRVSGYVEKTRLNGFYSVHESLKSTFNLARTLENSLAVTIKDAVAEDLKSKPFNEVKNQLEHVLHVNEEAFRAGAQVQYADKYSLVGIKQTKTEEGVGRLMYLHWVRNDTEGIPDPQLVRDNLVYYEYSNRTAIKNDALKMVPYSITPQLGELSSTKADEYGFKSIFGVPTIFSCPKKTDTCSYVLQYYTTKYDDPFLSGYFAIHIQLPFLPELLREATPSIATSFVLHAESDTIMGTSDPSIPVAYYWDEFADEYKMMKGSTIQQNAVIQQISLNLQETYGKTYDNIFDDDHLEKLKEMRINVHGAYYTVDYRPMVMNNLKLITVVYVGEWSYLMVPIIICICMILFCLTMLICMVACGIAVALAIHRPIIQFVENMDGITDGLDLERIRFGKNPYFTEFNNLHITFKYLVEKLKLYRTFLPDHILKQVEFYESEDGDERQKEKEHVDDEVDSNQVPSETSSLGTARSSINSSMVINEGEGTLQLKKFHVSYIIVKIAYATPKQVGANMSAFSKLLNLAIEVSRSKNGRVESFTDTEIVIGINTIARYKHHEKGACHVALRFMQGYTKLGFISSGILTAGLGISTGSNYVGTIGTLSKRAWQSIGSTLQKARHLASHAITLKTPILFDQEIKHAVSENVFSFRFVDELHFADSPHPQFCYHLVSSIITKNDEWIYEMNNEQKNKWCVDYNEAIHQLMSNDLDEATIVLNRFIAREPTDLVSKKYRALIRFLNEHNQTWKEYKSTLLSETPLSAGRQFCSILLTREFAM